jgi:hypothetical protein
MTDGISPESRIKGTLLAAHGKGIVRMEDRYDTSIEDLGRHSPIRNGWLAGSPR